MVDGKGSSGDRFDVRQHNLRSARRRHQEGHGPRDEPDRPSEHHQREGPPESHRPENKAGDAGPVPALLAAERLPLHRRGPRRHSQGPRPVGQVLPRAPHPDRQAAGSKRHLCVQVSVVGHGVRPAPGGEEPDGHVLGEEQERLRGGERAAAQGHPAGGAVRHDRHLPLQQGHHGAVHHLCLLDRPRRQGHGRKQDPLHTPRQHAVHRQAQNALRRHQGRENRPRPRARGAPLQGADKNLQVERTLDQDDKES
mmetsp:Transcript_2729/g.6531  ORF Transcript_2729/g.6531 Transcript_2729/m.6531 type:complete len:253 (-) Transcript_2729:72-830(-)